MLRLAIEKRRVVSDGKSWHSSPWLGDWGGLIGSGRVPLLPVVKTANLRYRDHGSEFRRVYGPRLRRVYSQREVCPGFVIIRQKRLQMPM